MTPNRRHVLAGVAATLLTLAGCGGKGKTQIGFTVDRGPMAILASGPIAEAEPELVALFASKLGSVGRGSSPDDKAAVAVLAAEAAAWLTQPETVAALEGTDPVSWTGKAETEDMVFELTMTM